MTSRARPTKRRAQRVAVRPRPAPELKQWIGQLKEDPSLWFLIWAPNRRAAMRLIKDDIGDIARGSLKEIQGAGYFVFRAVAKRSKVASAELHPPEGEYLIIYDHAAEAWILKRMSTETAPPVAPVVASKKRSNGQGAGAATTVAEALGRAIPVEQGSIGPAPGRSPPVSGKQDA